MDTARENELRRNFAAVREKIAAAEAMRAGGEFVPDHVTLLAATKTVPAEDINFAARELGLTHIGENRVPELLEKYDALDKERLNIHFIGSLQTNKVKYIIDKVSMIHSLDSVKLAAEIDRQAKKHDLVMDVLAEINIGREVSKGGVLPEDIWEFWEEVSKFSSIRLRGIMTMAPICPSNEEYRKYFQETYQIFIDILRKKSHNIIEPILSMGMSGSYEAAVLENSGMIRVGSALFGNRSYPIV